MKPSTILLSAPAALLPLCTCSRGHKSTIQNLPITRQGSTLLLDNKPWRAVGPNIYWLGLDENVIPPPGQPFYAPLHASYPTKGRVTEIMATVAALGGTMVRGHTLGVSTGNPLSLWPTQGATNPQAFEAIDWAVFQARAHGLRLLVPLTDNYDYYHGGKFDFLRWGGYGNLTGATDPRVQAFYTDAGVVGAFKAYVRLWLAGHVNPYTGLTYGEDPTVFAVETGNELGGPVFGDMDVPVEWTRDIARLVKEVAPGKLVVDGTYGVNETHLEVEEVDVFSDHFYPINVTKLRRGLTLVASANKSYFAGEFDWIGSGDDGVTPTGDSLTEWFSIIEESPVAAGDAFWSLFGHDVPNCDIFVNHTDGFTMQYNNPQNSPYIQSRIRLVRQHLIKMSQGRHISANASLPVVPCPASSIGPPEGWST